MSACGQKQAPTARSAREYRPIDFWFPLGFVSVERCRVDMNSAKRRGSGSRARLRGAFGACGAYGGGRSLVRQQGVVGLSVRSSLARSAGALWKKCAQTVHAMGAVGAWERLFDDLVKNKKNLYPCLTGPSSERTSKRPRAVKKGLQRQGFGALPRWTEH
jgi:hypothetical protein